MTTPKEKEVCNEGLEDEHETEPCMHAGWPECHKCSRRLRTDSLDRANDKEGWEETNQATNLYLLARKPNAKNAFRAALRTFLAAKREEMIVHASYDRNGDNFKVYLEGREVPPAFEAGRAAMKAEIAEKWKYTKMTATDLTEFTQWLLTPEK